MIITTIVWGAPAWLIPATILVVVGLVAIIWSYWHKGAATWLRSSAGLLKAVAVIALAVCLIEPLFSGRRPRPGENLFLLLADNSQSLQVRDRGRRQTRGERLIEQLAPKTQWQTRLSQDFDVRRYLFDTRLRPVVDFTEISLDGSGSSLSSSLSTLAQRFQGRHNAGVLIFTDGNATDFREDLIDWEGLPPLYPVMLGKDGPAQDISVSRVSVSQTNFEAAPVTVMAEVACLGYPQQPIVVQLLDEFEKQVQSKTLRNLGDGKPLTVRFQLRPDKKGVSFYSVRAFAESEEKQFEDSAKSLEATLVNNRRLVTVDRGGGPYRVLYVTGRPNWEFKFLRRSVEEDNEVDLVGLVRIAKREPKFTFRGHKGETNNPLYRGFGNQGEEEAEQHDQPVLLRIGVEDEEGAELRDGFPKAADQLFRYHALILDDVEAEFFTQDQMSLIQEFVSQRGGGFLMLGGQESFVKGEFDRTPIGELLPIYLDAPRQPAVDESFKLALTREGWLQPWVRLRPTELDEDKRLDAMPKFKTLNQMQHIKGGATVLAEVTSDDGKKYPALVVQRFGRGQASALLIGDFWRWNLRRESWAESDLEKSWRQTVRWLVSNVPQRIEVETRRQQDDPSMPLQLMVRVRDEMYKPLDNASVRVKVKTPDAKEIQLTAEPSDISAGLYKIDFVTRTPGAFRASVEVTAADGSDVGQRETGWTSQPATDEFRALMPNRALLERIAKRTGGEVIKEGDLHGFVSSLPNRKIPVTEDWIYPLWHQWSVFLLAVGCLVGEWGLRRWKGLP